MGSAAEKLGDIANDVFDSAKEFVGKASEKIEDVAREVSSTARDLTGNSLGIPGLDPGMLSGNPAPVTIAAMVVGGSMLGAGALAAEGGMTAADAASLGSMTEGAEIGAGASSAATGATGVEAAKYATLEGSAEAAKDVVTAAPELTGSAPGTSQAVDAAFGSGPASAPPPLTDEGTMSRISAWAEKNPKLASAMLTGAGMTMAGAAKGALDYATMKEKSQIDRDTLLEVARQKPLLYQQFVQQSSAGGGGVTIPFGPAAQRPPTTGLIGKRMGG